MSGRQRCSCLVAEAALHSTRSSDMIPHSYRREGARADRTAKLKRQELGQQVRASQYDRGDRPSGNRRLGGGHGSRHQARRRPSRRAASSRPRTATSMASTRRPTSIVKPRPASPTASCRARATTTRSQVPIDGIQAIGEVCPRKPQRIRASCARPI